MTNNPEDKPKWTPLDRISLDEGHGSNTYLLSTPLREASPELYEVVSALCEILEGDCNVSPCVGSMAPAEHWVGIGKHILAKARGEKP